MPAINAHTKIYVAEQRAFALFLTAFILSWGIGILQARGVLQNAMQLQIIVICIYLAAIIMKIHCLCIQQQFAKAKPVVVAFIVFFVFMVLRGFIEITTNEPSLSYWGYDTLTLVMIASAVLLVNLSPKEAILLLITYTIISIVLTAATITQTNISAVSYAADREAAWRNIDSWWTYYVCHRFYGFAPVITMLTFTFLKSIKYRLLAVPHLALFLFWGLYFGKRDVFIELAMLIAFFFIPWLIWSKEKRGKKITGGAILMILAGLSLYMFTSSASAEDLTKRILGRFASGLSEISQFDRLIETKEVMGTFDLFDFVTGKGLGSSSEFAIGGHILHMGVVNLLFKGGFIMSLVVTGYLLYNIFSAIFTPLPHKVFIFGISSYVLTKLTYSQLWGYFPIVMMLGIALLSRAITQGTSQQIKIKQFIISLQQLLSVNGKAKPNP